MPTEADRIFRDFVRYTGDGLPNEPVGKPLPWGDERSGVHEPSKKEIRDWSNVFEGQGQIALDAANLAVNAMVDVHGSTFWAANLAALRADTAASYPVGTVFATRAEGYAFQVVSSSPAITTSGGVMLQPAALAASVAPRMFGAAGNDLTNDRAAIQAAFVWGAANRIPVDMEGLTYRSNEAIFTDSNLRVVANGATIKFTAWPAVGGFLTNVWGSADTPSPELRRIQSNVYIEGLTLSGELLPAASPTENSNLFGFARGMDGAVIRDCRALKMRDGFGGGSGGAGFGDELGARNVLWDNCTAEDCFRGARVNAETGNFADAGGAAKWLRNIVFRDCAFIRCGTAVFAHAVGAALADRNKTDLSEYDVVFDGLNAVDCGHYPWRPIVAGLPAQKTGVITLSGCEGIVFKRLRICNTMNPNTFVDWLGRVGYPAGAGYFGTGLSGPIGAVVRGWGRDVFFDDVTVDGSYDAFWQLSMNGVFGDIYAGPPTSNTHGIRFNNVRHVAGSVGHVFDAMAGVTNAKVNAVIGPMQNHASPSVAIAGASVAAFTGVVLDFTTRGGNTQRGTVADFMSKGLAVFGPSLFTIASSFAAGGGYSAIGARKGLSYIVDELRTSTDTAAASTHQSFWNTNGLVGSISTAGSGTAYNTTSDKRLKADPRDIDGLGIVAQFRVYDYAWDSGGRGIGLFAQEAVEILPEAVSIGDSDDDWNAKAVADRLPWAIDYSRIVPVLIRAVQQLEARVQLLEGRP